MLYSNSACRVLAMFFLSGSIWSASAAAVDLSKNQVRELESVFLPAYEQGDTLGVLHSLDRVMRRMSNEQVTELDTLLDQQQIPKATHLMAAARMSLIEQGLTRDLPRPSPRELLLTLAEIETQVSAIEKKAGEHRALLTEGEGPTSFDEFEALVWQAHVLEQKLHSAIRLTDFAQAMQKSKKRLKSDGLNETELALLDRDYTRLADRLEQTLADVAERELIARVKRLTFATKVLRENDDLKDRYQAAWSIDFDGPLVREALTKGGGEDGFHTQLLNDDQLHVKINQTIEEGFELAGELLITKSRHLFTGLHWWMRARYGAGPEGFGLLKTAAAVRSDAALFPLFMPEETPVPTAPDVEGDRAVPEVDRRHLYVWAWEYRDVTASVRSKTQRSVTSRSRRTTSETQLSRFY